MFINKYSGWATSGHACVNYGERVVKENLISFTTPRSLLIKGLWGIWWKGERDYYRTIFLLLYYGWTTQYPV